MENPEGEFISLGVVLSRRLTFCVVLHGVALVRGLHPLNGVHEIFVDEPLDDAAQAKSEGEGDYKNEKAHGFSLS